MRHLLPLAFLCFVLPFAGCDEPDHWEATSTPSAGDPPPPGGGTIGIRTRGAALGGVVNAPVAPEAIYLGLGGGRPGISVVDCNGFGQGTGNPATSSFPLNPNVGAPGVVPPLAPGTSALDAGSDGALTLTRNSFGSTLLVDDATVGEIAELQLGQPLDLVFNNSNINVNASAANQVNPANGVAMPGNSIMVAPHPNPPRLVFPPPNPGMGIEAEEPTVATSQAPQQYPFLPLSPPCLPSPVNLLVPGDPFSSQPGMLGIFAAGFPGAFYGPQPPPPSPPPPPPFCPYTSRQQIGHFLYALDLGNRRVVALNSNRFTVLASFAMPDPVDMAVSPNLELLAVSNSSTGDVRFIDIDPRSATFHLVIAQTRIAPGITELAWQPEGEDLLVVNPSTDTLTILDAPSLNIRRQVAADLRGPMDVAVSARQTSFGFGTGTWFAFVLNRDGSVAVFESGPAGPGGPGPDDMLGTIGGLTFPRARSIHADFALGAGFWVTHTDASGLGQVSRVELVQAPAGPQTMAALPLDPNTEQLAPRGRLWQVTARHGGSNPNTPVATLLSGNAPVDLAFDDITNRGGLLDQTSPAVPGLRYPLHNGKGLVKLGPGGAVAARSPILMFVALADTGTVDVIELATGTRLATVQAPGIRTLCDYWRQ